MRPDDPSDDGCILTLTVVLTRGDMAAIRSHLRVPDADVALIRLWVEKAVRAMINAAREHVEQHPEERPIVGKEEGH